MDQKIYCHTRPILNLKHNKVVLGWFTDQAGPMVIVIKKFVQKS